MRSTRMVVLLSFAFLFIGISTGFAQSTRWAKVQRNRIPPSAFKASNAYVVCRAKVRGQIRPGYANGPVGLCHVADGRGGQAVSSYVSSYEVLTAPRTTQWSPPNTPSGLVNAGTSDNQFLGICRVNDGRVGWIRNGACVVHKQTGQNKHTSQRISEFVVLADPEAAAREAKAYVLEKIPSWKERLSRILTSDGPVDELKQRKQTVISDVKEAVSTVPEAHQDDTLRSVARQLSDLTKQVNTKISEAEKAAELAKAKGEIDALVSKANGVIQSTSKKGPSAEVYETVLNERKALATQYETKQQDPRDAVQTYANEMLPPRLKALDALLRYLEKNLPLSAREKLFTAHLKTADLSSPASLASAFEHFARFYRPSDPLPVVVQATKALSSFGTRLAASIAQQEGEMPSSFADTGLKKRDTTGQRMQLTLDVAWCSARIREHISPQAGQFVQCTYGLATGARLELTLEETGDIFGGCASTESALPAALQKELTTAIENDGESILASLKATADCKSLAKQLPKGGVQKTVKAYCGLMKKEEKLHKQYCKHVTAGWKAVSRKRYKAVEKAYDRANAIAWDGREMRYWRTGVDVDCPATTENGDHDSLYEVINEHLERREMRDAEAKERKRIKKLMRSVPKFESICKKQLTINRSAQKTLRRAAARGNPRAVERANDKLTKSARLACDARRSVIEVYNIYRNKGNRMAAESVWRSVPTCRYKWTICE